VTPEGALARVLGVMESLQLAMQAIGSGIAAALIAAVGTRSAMVVTGALLPIVGLAFWRPVSRSDRGPLVSRHVLELIMGVPMFRPLGAARVEHVAAQLEPRIVEAGADIIREGDVGDAFYVLEDGAAEALVGDRVVAEYERGGYFGEIALLRDVPRTATVRATRHCRLMMLGREDFLVALADDAIGQAAASAVVEERIALTEEIARPESTPAIE
jgi:hypothetical protein